MKNKMVLNITAKLQGAASGGVMTTFLNQLRYIPNKAKNAYPSYSGKESRVINGMVDWVLIRFREDDNGKPSENIIHEIAGKLLLNGSIKTKNINLSKKSYWIEVFHRNHLRAISHKEVVEVDGALVYDFTAQDGYKKDAFDKSQTEVNGEFMLYAGNTINNNSINSADETEIKNNLGNLGYLASDVNLDGVVNSQDLDRWAVNQGVSQR